MATIPHNNCNKKKHVLIYDDIHSKLKFEAKKAGMQLSAFINEMLNDALEYKKFLEK